MDSAAWYFTHQCVMGMFSCHHKVPFALTAAASHCMAGGRVTQPVPAVAGLCRCQVLGAPTDSSALHMKTRSTGRMGEGGLLLALSKPAPPLSPLSVGTCSPPSGASPGRKHRARGWALSAWRENAFASPLPVRKVFSFPLTRAREAQRSGLCSLPWLVAHVSRQEQRAGWPKLACGMCHQS